MPIAHPGLMRLSTTRTTTSSCIDNWAWFDAPLRDKPSGNLLERTYQRMVEPMPGLRSRARARLALHPDLPEHDHRPLSGPDRDLADPPEGHRRHSRRRPDAAAARAPACGTRAAQFANRKVNKLVSDEDVDLVANQQAGIATRGFEPGPLSRREAAVGWFADRIRADLGEACVSDPPGRGARERILAAAVDRIASGRHRRHAHRPRRDPGGRLDLARPLPLRDARGAPRARRSSTPTSWPATCASARARARRPSHVERLAALIDQFLPYPGTLERDWILWVELWLRDGAPSGAAPDRRRGSTRRMRDWLAEAIAAGIDDGAFDASADPGRVADRLMALARRLRRARADRRSRHRLPARRQVWAGLADELGLPEEAPRRSPRRPKEGARARS